LCNQYKQNKVLTYSSTIFSSFAINGRNRKQIGDVNSIFHAAGCNMPSAIVDLEHGKQIVKPEPRALVIGTARIP
jgi:hypothetical protein